MKKKYKYLFRDPVTRIIFPVEIENTEQVYNAYDKTFYEC